MTTASPPPTRAKALLANQRTFITWNPYLAASLAINIYIMPVTASPSCTLINQKRPS